MYDKYTQCHSDASTQLAKESGVLCLQNNSELNDLELKRAARG